MSDNSNGGGGGSPPLFVYQGDATGGKYPFPLWENGDNNYIQEARFLQEATQELDTEFPGAEYDESLQRFIKRREWKKKIIRGMLFHGLGYSALSAFFYWFAGRHGLGFWGSMTFGLTYFALYIAVRETVESFREIWKWNKTESEYECQRPTDEHPKN